MTDDWCEGDQMGIFYLERGVPITAHQLRTLAQVFPEPVTKENESDPIPSWRSAPERTDPRVGPVAVSGSQVEGCPTFDPDVVAPNDQVLLATGILMERYALSARLARAMLRRTATHDECSLQSAAAYLLDTGLLGFRD